MPGHAHTTKREIRSFFLNRGLRPKKSLGQNFLVDGNLLRVIVEAAGVGERDLVLEIGCGTGAITELLAERCRHVVGVEIDDRLCAVMRGTLADVPNLTLVRGSILGKGDTIAEPVLEALAAVETVADGAFHVVGDLPYSIATPTVAALLRLDPMPASITVVVQAEVGERIAATPGTKAYGLMSALVQARARTEVVRRLPPHVFWPRPKVQSALLRIEPDETLHAPQPSVGTVKRAASALFTHRRKTAANAVSGSDLVETKGDASALLERAGIDPAARADAIPVEQIVELARLIEAEDAGW